MLRNLDLKLRDKHLFQLPGSLSTVTNLRAVGWIRAEESIYKISRAGIDKKEQEILPVRVSSQVMHVI